MWKPGTGPWGTGLVKMKTLWKNEALSNSKIHGKTNEHK